MLIIFLIIEHSNRPAVAPKEILGQESKEEEGSGNT